MTDDDNGSASNDGDSVGNSSDRNSGGSAGSGTVYTDNADTDNVDSAGRYTRQTVACSSAGNGACANVVAISFYDGPYE